MNLISRWLGQLETLRAQGRLRGLHDAAGVDLSSNDYLGYAKLPAEQLPRGLSRSGAASRLLRGHHPIWDEVESSLAAWHGAEAALVMTSGYVANLGLLSTSIEPGDIVFSDASNHASIIDGLKLSRANREVYRHLDVNHLEDLMRQATPTRRADNAWYIVTESLFSMEGDKPPAELLDLGQRFDAQIVVDEAHATGCFGAVGGGVVDQGGFRSRVLATVHTGGKALGVPGAYICCSELLKQLLVNRCRQFIFTTALPPLVGAWWLHALERVRADQAARARLHANARLFRDELTKAGVEALGNHYIVPVLLGDDQGAMRAAADLQKQGFDIRAIRPPTVPEGTARLRISIHGDHDADTLRRTAAAVAAVAGPRQLAGLSGASQRSANKAVP